jgi:hypothetical protein
MPITILEIIASDTISQLVDKTNFNFDQLLLNGGGPAGPPGIQGPTGPAGGRGPKGSTWFEDTSQTSPGNNPNTIPPTATPLTGDYYLQFDGWVWEYIGTTWVQTTINIMGPPGSTGPAGGFGLTFGSSPSLLNKNTLYNGQLGTLTTGANSVNEGVPSVMLGGVSSIYTNPIPATSPALTAAYVLPSAIELGLSSDVASVLIHQKDSTGKSIIFHGGNGTGNTDFYNQTNIGELSNIGIGIDDRLILEVPKIAEGTISTMDDLIGFQVDSIYRSQAYNTGQQIRFATGLYTVDYGIPNENSNFEISVGTGGSNTKNKFHVETLSAGAKTTLQMGGDIQLLPAQNTNSGKYQLLSGATRFVTTNSVGGTGEFAVRAQGDINLNTLIIGASPSANIGLISGAGGITANSTGGGISIVQLSTSSTSDIIIDQYSSAGDLSIRSNSNTILRKLADADATISPSITLDYTTIIAPVGAHTRFVGPQAWAPVGMGVPKPNLTTNIQQLNYLGDTMLSGNTFRYTGSPAADNYEPGSAMERWVGGPQDSNSVDAGLITIINGNEGSPGAIPAADFMQDNSLEISVRNSINTEDYITLGKGKLGLATPIVHKRARGLNDATNKTPSNRVGGISNNGQSNYLDAYGWDTRQQSSPSPTASMPTMEQLNVPFITLAFGRGVGKQPNNVSNPDASNPGYNYAFDFPIGAYPGQQLILKFVHYASSSYRGGLITSNYGQILIRIPGYRRKAVTYGSGAWSSWYDANPTPTQEPNSPAYYPLGNTMTAVNAQQGKFTQQTLTMVWDGGIVQLPGSAIQTTNNETQVQQQMGWVITSATTLDSYMNQDYPSGTSGPTITTALRTVGFL